MLYKKRATFYLHEHEITISPFNFQARYMNNVFFESRRQKHEFIHSYKQNLKGFHALSFYRFQNILCKSKCFEPVQFWSGSNQTFLVYFFCNLDLSKMIWTRPKQIGPVQNNWYSTKMIWLVQNNFGPIEGQGISVVLSLLTSLILLLQSKRRKFDFASH